MPDTEQHILGAVGIDDRGANFHPDSWRRAIHNIRLHASPMLALTKATSRDKVTSHHFHWASQPFATGEGALTGTFTDAGLSAAYASGAVSGTTLYLKMAAADAQKVRATDVITMIYSAAKESLYQAWVQAINVNGASSYLQVRMMVADASGDISNTNSAAGNVDYILTGNAQEEMSPLVDPQFAEPSWHENYTQTSMDSSELSFREIAELDRNDPNVRVRAKMQSLARLERKKEMSAMFGIFLKETGQNNKPVTFTRGIVPAIQEFEPNHVFDYTIDDHPIVGTEFGGVTWDNGGLDFLEIVGEETSRFGEAPHKTVYCGSSALRFVSRAARKSSHYNIETMTTVWGISITKLHMPGQDWHLVEHPLFSAHTSFRDAMLVTERQLLRIRTLRPLKFIDGQDNSRSGHEYVSGIKEGWEVDWGLQYDNLQAFAWIVKVGQDNAA